jgi:hypothetical protein
MSTASVRSSVRPTARDDRGSPAWIWALGLCLVALLVLVVAWLAGWIRFTTDPRVTEIIALQEQARERFGTGSGPSSLADAAAMPAQWSPAPTT